MDTPSESIIHTRRSLSRGSFNVSTPNNVSINRIKSPGLELAKVATTNTRKRPRIKIKEDRSEAKLCPPHNYPMKRKNGISKVFDSSSSMGNCSSPDILPLRRSRREKTLVYANFTPEEINNTIQKKHLVEAFSEEDELEPYEKLFSPISKKPKNFAGHVSTHTYSTRSNNAITSGLTEVKRHSNRIIDTSQEDSEEVLVIDENESDVSNKNEDDGTIEETERVEGEGTGEGEGSDEVEGTDEEEVEVELDEEESGYYNLRKRTPVVYQYQPVIQVVDKKTHKKTKKSSYSSYRSAAYHPRTVRRSKDKFRKAHQDSTTSSSSEDSDEERFKRRKSRSMKRSRMECLPMNFAPEDVGAGPIRDRAHIGTSLADISPMGVDRSITFDSIGGLKDHIRGLKEMIMFPLMYPEVFDKFNISPPRGVLFHGPPGCGKTLVARALANECSSENRKVAFFMRKGADCLSKWVGESERQLRLLFDQAYQMRPSILFFDEIDGLAPVRSTRQDQIHSSIVSTLLALMDGLDSRGEIVVIGATNRIDSIDPALRRPGRFDREFVFPLPTRQDRKTILQIHTKSWQPPLQGHFLEELSELTVGYCGADMKALCTEAAMHSLRRQYPQIYKSSDKLVIDVSKLVVSGSDFHLAYKGVVPTGQRSAVLVSRPLSDVVFPLVGFHFKALLNQLLSVFPQSWKCVRKGLVDLDKRIETDRARRREIEEMGVAFRPAHIPQHNKWNDRLLLNKIDGVFFDPQDSFATTNTDEIRPHPHALPPVHRPRLLITGAQGMGQSDHLLLALVHACEDLPVKVLDSSALLGSASQSPEEACLQIIREACRVVPCIVYIPRVASLWEIMSEGFKATLQSVMDSLPPDMPLLLLGSTECRAEALSGGVKQLFDVLLGNVFETTPPTAADRMSFFHEVLMNQPLLDPPQTPLPAEEAVYEPLPLAPPLLPRELTETETDKLCRQREAVLRELRVFLRETTNRLLAERKFKEFTKPVDSEEVPDYYDIIDNPMDLSTIMKRIDEHQYSIPSQWLKDIDLITKNALEYNPEHDTESRLLRHRAVALQDLAHSIFDHDLNEEFEKQCEDIDSSYKRINNIQSNPSKDAPPSPTDSLPYLTPRASLSSKPTDLQDDRSLEVRRSLRNLRVQPDTNGLPYYAPSKSRTPRKQEEESSKEPRSEDITMCDNETDAPVMSDSVIQHDNQTFEFNVVIQKALSISSRKLSFSTKQKTSSTSSGSFDTRSTSSAPPPFMAPPTLQKQVIIDRARLVQLFNKVVKSTASCSVDECLKVYAMLSQLVFRHRMEWNREQLLEELDVAVQELQRLQELQRKR